MRWLITWLGEEEKASVRGSGADAAGLIAEFLDVHPCDRVLLLHDRASEAMAFAALLGSRRRVRTDVLGVALPRPHDLADAHARVLAALDTLAARAPSFRSDPKCFLLSPGSKAMATALLLVGSSAYPGELHVNWADPAEPDPARRSVILRVPEAPPPPVPSPPLPGALADEVLRDGEGREITRTAAVRDLYALAARLAVTDRPVLIAGEMGTGKELLARHVHGASPRRARRFVPVPCDAIPDSRLDAHLFGHARGAFPGAAADGAGLFGAAEGGTLFLDEVSGLPPETQARLLRFLQDGEIVRLGETRPRRADVRLVAATSRDLRHLVREGRFRPDLYFRLAPHVLTLPPLRERPDDLRPLGEALLEAWRRDAEPRVQIDDGAWRALAAYDWPGNLRELHGILGRCLAEARPGRRGESVVDEGMVKRAIAEQGLGLAPAAPAAAPAGDWVAALAQQLLAAGKPYGEAMFAVEAAVIGRVIGVSRSRAEAARRLSITPQALNGKLKTLRRRGLAV